MSNKTLVVTGIALVVIIYFIGRGFSNEVPAQGSPRLPISGLFMFNDLEEIVAPVKASFTESTTSATTTTREHVVISEESRETDLEDTLETKQFQTETIVENLTIPWDIVMLPNGNLLITERGGRLIEFNVTSGDYTSIDVSDVLHAGEGGLMGMALHPDFQNNHYVYLYRTSSLVGKSKNSVVRYVYENKTLSDELMIVDTIPGAFFHNGGRIDFGPDGFLYVATGDAQDPELSQDIKSLAGKILRVTDDGSLPEGNPYDNEVYSYGHRNPQGLTWDDDGALWSTEHGRSGARSGLDELNLIIKGGNYGWPKSQGDLVLPNTIGPIIHSGTDTTWAPSSAVYVGGSIFFGGLRGEALYEAKLSGVTVTALIPHFEGEFGRIRTVIAGPDNSLYMTTSNRDGRGEIHPDDDRIIRVQLD